jgi:hypothetical protein
MSPPIRYLVTVPHVREIALRGGADLAYWRERLQREGLEPAERAGQAELHLGATSARFLGIPFRELVLCVVLQEPPGIYLAYAYNSVRAFAWFERTLFRTPYYAARIDLELDPAPQFEVSLSSGRLLRADMSPESAAALRRAGPGEDVVWEVPVYLPRPPAKHATSNIFYARLSGLTQTCPFMPECDTFEMASSVNDGTPQMLVESAFSPREWIVRADAIHSKSKTVRRPAAGG